MGKSQMLMHFIKWILSNAENLVKLFSHITLNNSNYGSHQNLVWCTMTIHIDFYLDFMALNLITRTMFIFERKITFTQNSTSQLSLNNYYRSGSRLHSTPLFIKLNCILSNAKVQYIDNVYFSFDFTRNKFLLMIQ